MSTSMQETHLPQPPQPTELLADLNAQLVTAARQALSRAEYIRLVRMQVTLANLTASITTTLATPPDAPRPV